MFSVCSLGTGRKENTYNSCSIFAYVSVVSEAYLSSFLRRVAFHCKFLFVRGHIKIFLRESIIKNFRLVSLLSPFSNCIY
jgi:hypothetical protein